MDRYCEMIVCVLITVLTIDVVDLYCTCKLYFCCLFASIDGICPFLSNFHYGE